MKEKKKWYIDYDVVHFSFNFSLIGLVVFFKELLLFLLIAQQQQFLNQFISFFAKEKGNIKQTIFKIQFLRVRVRDLII